jgi:hypothetical protein
MNLNSGYQDTRKSGCRIPGIRISGKQDIRKKQPVGSKPDVPVS